MVAILSRPQCVILLEYKSHLPRNDYHNHLWANRILRDLCSTHFPWCHINASVNRVSIGSDNDFSPGRRQAIIRTSAGILLAGPPSNFSEISIDIHTLVLKKFIWKCHCLNVLTILLQPITWANAHLLSIGPWGININETLIKIQISDLVEDCSNSSALAMELLH